MDKSEVSDGYQLSLHYDPGEKESFLSELADYVLTKYGSSLHQLSVIFPNRRAGIYFLRELSFKSQLTGWAPKVYSLEDFYTRFSPLVSVDRYSLVFRLFRIYQEVYQSEESLDNFFFWGEMLLRDFDEIDKQLVNAHHLFSTLSEFKSLEDIEYLDEEQKSVITGFWQSVDKSRDKNNWTSFWSRLQDVYSQFREDLLKEGLGYNGLILRSLCDNIENIDAGNDNYLFAGFNVLGSGEEKLISYFLKEKHAEILWDYDIHYMSEGHEAGKFLKKYQKLDIFNKGFKEITSEHLAGQKNIKVISTGTWIGQLKVVGQLLEELSTLPGWEEESTVIVLPDEKLLLPLLNAIPKSIQDVNVTMGISLRYTSSFSFLENYILLLKGQRDSNSKSKFYFRNILTLLRHPLYQAISENDAGIFEKNVLKTKELYYDSEDLKKLGIAYPEMFDTSDSNIPNKLSEVAYYFFCNAPNRLEKIFLNALYHHLDRLSVTFDDYGIELGYDAMVRLFRQIAATGRIPFAGEPVKGLQIMGVFETRNLDFDNVFIVSMNEGMFPRGLTSQSFIPYALRKAYRMPTFEDNQSIQSYLFYRLLQRSKRVHLLYNAIGEIIGGEVSRYIQQLKYGGKLHADFVHLKETYQPDEKKEVRIGETDHIDQSLSRYFEQPHYLSPTALNTYLICSLKFYLKYILRLREDSEVEEEIDAKVYGLLLHESAEYLYGQFKGKSIESAELLEQDLDRAISEAFNNTVFDQESGYPRIRREILHRTLKRLIEVDSNNFPIEVVDVEPKIIYPLEIQTGNGKKMVHIGGKLDRVDKVGGHLRVIDYKTGTDEPRFDSFDTLFEGQNSAAFQLFCYSLLLKNSEYYDGSPITAELYSMRDIFKKSFLPRLAEGKGKKKYLIKDVRDRLPEFESRLKGMITEIFVKQEFEQTEDLSKCRYCEFSTICRRQSSRNN